MSRLFVFPDCAFYPGHSESINPHII